jgi:hypothetical protein
VEGSRGFARLLRCIVAILGVAADVNVARQQHAAGAKDPTAACPLAAELDAVGGGKSAFFHAVEMVTVLL